MLPTLLQVVQINYLHHNQSLMHFKMHTTGFDAHMSNCNACPSQMILHFMDSWSTQSVVMSGSLDKSTDHPFWQSFELGCHPHVIQLAGSSHILLTQYVSTITLYLQSSFPFATFPILKLKGESVVIPPEPRDLHSFIIITGSYFSYKPAPS